MYKLRSSLPVLALALASACAPNTSTVGQRITCETDADSGVILSCEPGDGDGGADSCTDIDEDGDGQPEDDDAGEDGAGSGTDEGAGGDGSLSFTEESDSDDGEAEDCDEDADGLDDGEDPDDDNDGIDDGDDCDEEEGQDGNEADLPYDVKMQVGDTVTPISDAFAEKGAQPAAVLSVEMDGGGAGWRLAELQAGATYTVTDADCAHAGNRDIGRDRVIVTWRNADGGVESDHLDLRYCEE